MHCVYDGRHIWILRDGRDGGRVDKRGRHDKEKTCEGDKEGKKELTKAKVGREGE